MTETTILEPSIADALKAIETAAELTATQRSQWCCSLRQTCAYLNRQSRTRAGSLVSNKKHGARPTCSAGRRQPEDAGQSQIERSDGHPVVRKGEGRAEVGAPR